MKTRKCSRCGKRFTTDHGTQMHIDAAHKGEGTVEKIPFQRDDHDESFADRAVDAEIDRAMGVYNPDQDWLLP